MTGPWKVSSSNLGCSQQIFGEEKLARMLFSSPQIFNFLIWLEEISVVDLLASMVFFILPEVIRGLNPSPQKLKFLSGFRHESLNT